MSRGARARSVRTRVCGVWRELEQRGEGRGETNAKYVPFGFDVFQNLKNPETSSDPRTRPLVRGCEEEEVAEEHGVSVRKTALYKFKTGSAFPFFEN